ncbi:MAG: DUF2341 domain-containing protein [Candidatus Thorarchaeota archaeon]
MPPRFKSYSIFMVFFINIIILNVQIQNYEIHEEKTHKPPNLLSNVTRLNYLDRMDEITENNWNIWQSFPPGSNKDPDDELLEEQDSSLKSSIKLGGYWGEPSFRYRKNITIDSIKVVTDLQDFPVLIDLYDSDLHLDVQADGDDILFTDSSGTKLDHELEYFNQTYNSTHAHLVAWVRIPMLSSTTNTIISMYYGNSGVGSQENPQGVWDSDYLAVWHFNEDVIDEDSGILHYDSTINTNHGIQDGNDDESGKIGDGQSFDGSNDKVNVPPDQSLNPNTDVTLSGWFRLKTNHSISSSTSQLLFEKFTSNDLDMVIILAGTDYAQGENGTLVFKIENGDVRYKWTDTNTWTPNDWYYVTCLLDTNNLANNKIYINGLDDTRSTDWSSGNSTNLGWNSDWNIGGGNVDTGQLGDGQAWFNGTIDEVRISGVLRSTGWISTEYSNQYDPESFYFVGEEEEYFGGSTVGFRTYHGSFRFLSGTEIIQDIGGSVDLNHAFLIMYYAGGGSAGHPCKHQVSGYLISSSQIKFDRAAEDSNVSVSWWVVESPEIFVQRGLISIEPNQTNKTISVSVVDPSRSIVIGHSRINDPSAKKQDTQDGFVTVELQDATTVKAERADTATDKAAIIRFQVVEWSSEYNVYTGETTINNTDQLSELVTGFGNPDDLVINMSSSWVYFTYDCTENGLQQTSIYGQITDTNEVTFGRYDNSSYTNRIRWYVVEHPPKGEVFVQRGSYNWDPPNSGLNIRTNNIPIQVDPDRTLIIQSSSTSSTGLSFPRQKNLPRLISGSQWTSTQYYGVIEDYDQHEEYWQIISFSPPDITPPIVHDFGVDDLGNGSAQFWANVSDTRSNVDSVILDLNGTLWNMTLNETDLWIYQPLSINYGDFFIYSIHNATDTSGNLLHEGSFLKNITFIYDIVSPTVLNCEYFSYIGFYGTFIANVTDPWGKIDTVIVNVTQYAGIERNDLTAIMRTTISGYINDTLQIETGTILFEVIVTDKGGNSYTSYEQQGIVNIPPIASNLTLFPDPLYCNDTLTLSYDFYDPDNDTEEGTEIRWYKNFILEPAYNDMNQIPAYELFRGEKWNASVRPKDGKEFGELVWSSIITVYNTAPSANNLNLTPSIPKTIHDLVATYDYIDIDGDPEIDSIIRWYKNGIEEPTFEDQTIISASDTNRGESWYFTIEPNDGSSYGALKTSPSVTIINTEPEIISAELGLVPESEYVYTNDILFAFIGVNDSDNDPYNLNVVWLINNTVEVPSLENENRVLPNYTKKGQIWSYKVRAFDGFDWSDFELSSGRYIENSEPFVQNVTLNGGLNTTNDIILSYDYFDADGDPENSQVIWTIIHTLSNPPLRTVTQDNIKTGTSLLLNTEFTAGDSIWVQIIPGDGFSTGSIIQSDFCIKVGNAAPKINTTLGLPEILSDDPNGTFITGFNTIFVNYSFLVVDVDNFDESEDKYHIAIDENGLVVGSEYYWYKNGKLVSDLINKYNVSSDYLFKGDIWIVSVCPKDLWGDTGSWVNSSPIIIGNGQPAIYNLKFIGNDAHPHFLVEDQDVNINYTFVRGLVYRKDDFSILKWYVNGVYRSEYDGQKLISAVKTHPGEIWTIKVYPFDGVENGITSNLSVIIESRPTINSFGIEIKPDSEGYYHLWVNVSDVRNPISEVCVAIAINGTEEQSWELKNSPWEIDFLLSEEEFALFINTTIIVNVTALATTQYYEKISYEIGCTKSFNYTIIDRTPPRVIDTYFEEVNQNPTNITFYADIQEFGLGVEKVFLLYCFETCNKTEQVGIGSSTSQEGLKWYKVEMLFDSEKITSNGKIQVYSVTIPFNQNGTDWNLFYGIETVDKDGNKNDFTFAKKEINYNNQKFILAPESLFILIFIIITIILISSGCILVYQELLKRKVIEQDIKHKFNIMNSIRMIFCRTSYGVQFYSEQTVGNFETDIDVLSGFSTAISDFIKNVSVMMTGSEEDVLNEQKTQFEALSSDGFNILVWNGSYSSVAIISEKILPKRFRVNLRRIGREIESTFADELLKYFSPKQIPSNKIKRILRKHLPLYYCTPLALNNEVSKSNIITKLSKKEQQMWTLIYQHLGSNLGLSSPERIVRELSSMFKRSNAIKFLEKAVKLNFLLEIPLQQSNGSSNHSIKTKQRESKRKLLQEISR